MELGVVLLAGQSLTVYYDNSRAVTKSKGTQKPKTRTEGITHDQRDCVER